MATQPTTYGPLLIDLLFEKADVGLCLVTPDDTVLRANAEWLRSNGFTAEQVVGENIIDLFPAARDTVLAMHARARAGGRVEVPRHAHQVSGRETWWEGSIEPVPMEGGTGLLITAREVSAGVNAVNPDLGAIAHEEAKYRRLFENSMHAVYLTRAGDGAILDANPAACRMHGMTVEEIRERGRAGLVVMDEAFLSSLKRQAASGHTRGELTFLRKDGTTFPVEVESVYLDRSSPKPLAFTMAHDITERKRAEEALHFSEERQRSLGDNLPNGAIYRYQADEDDRPRFLYISRGIERVIGVSPDEIVGDASAVLDTILPEDRAHLDREETRSRETLAPFEVEVRLRHRATREVRWALLRSVPQRLPTGATVWDGVYVDITARKRAEEALRENEGQLRAAFASSPDAININRVRDGAFVAVNERFEELSLWPRAEVMGKTVVDLNIWVDWKDRERLLMSLLNNGSVKNVEVGTAEETGAYSPLPSRRNCSRPRANASSSR
jgi:PAS domain S-box-containing protein